MKDEMMHWGVTLGKRRTNRGKSVFLDEVEILLKEQDISYSIFEKKSSIMKIRHLIINQPSRAKVVIATAYDTPEIAMLSSYRWYPFNMDQNRNQDIKNLILNTATALIFWVAAAILILNLAKAGTIINILFVLAAVILAYTGWRFLKGRSNCSNYSMNSAAVAAVMKLISEYGQDQNVSFILMDESVTSLQGAKMLKEAVSSSTPMLILGNLANGSEHMLVHAADSDEKNFDCGNDLQLNRKRLTDRQIEQCLIGQYPHSMILTYGDRDSHDLVITDAKHSNDYNVDMNTLESSVEIIRKYIKKKGVN